MYFSCQSHLIISIVDALSQIRFQDDRKNSVESKNVYHYRTILLTINQVSYLLICYTYIPFTYWYEFQDVLVLLKFLKNPPDNLDIFNYMTFVTGTMRSSHKLKFNQ